MKYVVFMWMGIVKSRDTRKAVSHLEQSGKMYRKILNVICVLLERISSLRSKEKITL